VLILPALFPLAAFAAVELVGRVRDAIDGRARVQTASVCGLFLVFAVFVDLPVRSTTDTWRYRVASTLHLPVQRETTAGARFNLGVTYARRAGDAAQGTELLSLAEAELRAAVGEEPLARYHVELGKVLAREQRNDEAIAQYHAAAELEPLDYRVHHALGLLYRRVGQNEAAATAFGEALRLEPRHAASAVQLGQVLLESGRTTEAAAAFRHALRLRPDDRQAREGLAAAESR
jgi:tetratricopeptide (TPR) repeat protein